MGYSTCAHGERNEHRTCDRCDGCPRDVGALRVYRHDGWASRLCPACLPITRAEDREADARAARGITAPQLLDLPAPITERPERLTLL